MTAPRTLLGPLVAAGVTLALLSGCGLVPAGDPDPAETSAGPVDEAPDDETTDDETDSEEEEPVDPVAATRATIIGAFETLDTYLIEPVLSDPTEVLIAASEYWVEVDPVQATVDLNYVVGDGAAWSFDIPPAELATWRTHFYAPHIPEGAVIGRSTSGAVVAFTLNADGVVTKIFMAISDELMLH
jgi:hypothetical protein